MYHHNDYFTLSKAESLFVSIHSRGDHYYLMDSTVRGLYLSCYLQLRNRRLDHIPPSLQIICIQDPLREGAPFVIAGFGQQPMDDEFVM